MTKYSVGGFTFTDEQTAKQAAKELRAVEYIIKQLKEADDDEILKLYNKIVAQSMFTTEVGLSFLDQLKKNLINTGKIPSDSKVIKKDVEIKDRESDVKVKKEAKSTKSINKEKKVENKKQASESEQLLKLKRINLILTVISITLGLCVLGMFYVNSTINSPTILNYEEEILNKYSTWEHELSEREDAIRDKEHSSE